MLALAVMWKMRPDNPCRGVERNGEDKRQRYATAAEVKRLSKALAEHDDRDAADIFTILLLTGARRGEVLKARWNDFDLDKGVWTKPGATTKIRTTHVVPLSAAVIALLSSREKISEFVFAGRVGGHRVEIKANWRRICKAAKINGLRVHDLRHSYASALVNAGASLPLIGSMLGHAQASTTLRYSHLLDATQRQAAEQVAAEMLSAPPSHNTGRPR